MKSDKMKMCFLNDGDDVVFALVDENENRVAERKNVSCYDFRLPMTMKIMQDDMADMMNYAKSKVTDHGDEKV